MSSTQSNNAQSNANNTIDSHQNMFIPPIQPIQVNIQIIFILNYYNTIKLMNQSPDTPFRFLFFHNFNIMFNNNRDLELD